MKKLVIAIAVLFAAGVNADTRIGGGVSLNFGDYGTVESLEVREGVGFEIEAGHDINSIVGLNASYTKSDMRGVAGRKPTTLETVKLDADIGHTFQFSDSTMKVYGVVGLVKYDVNHHNGESAQGTTGLVGAGVRAGFDKVYVDLRSDMFSKSGVFSMQSAITVGYKF